MFSRDQWSQQERHQSHLPVYLAVCPWKMPEGCSTVDIDKWHPLKKTKHLIPCCTQTWRGELNHLRMSHMIVWPLSAKTVSRTCRTGWKVAQSPWSDPAMIMNIMDVFFLLDKNPFLPSYLKSNIQHSHPDWPKHYHFFFFFCMLNAKPTTCDPLCFYQLVCGFERKTSCSLSLNLKSQGDKCISYSSSYF